MFKSVSSTQCLAHGVQRTTHHSPFFVTTTPQKEKIPLRRLRGQLGCQSRKAATSPETAIQRGPCAENKSPLLCSEGGFWEVSWAFLKQHSDVFLLSFLDRFEFYAISYVACKLQLNYFKGMTPLHGCFGAPLVICFCWGPHSLASWVTAGVMDCRLCRDGHRIIGTGDGTRSVIVKRNVGPGARPQDWTQCTPQKSFALGFSGGGHNARHKSPLLWDFQGGFGCTSPALFTDGTHWLWQTAL